MNKSLTINDVFSHLEKVTTKGTSVYFNIVTKGGKDSGILNISLSCLDVYNVAEGFKYNNKFYFKPSEITHEIVVKMIEYIDYHKRGVKIVKRVAEENVKPKEDSVLKTAHRIGGVEAVNAFLLAGLNNKG
jgi:hypothetical protein